MSSKKKPSIHLFAVLSLALSIISTSSFAASNCKGENEKVCGNKDSCNWIKSHKRKDGANVKAYCRSKPQKNNKLAVKKTIDETKNQIQTVIKKPVVKTKPQPIITPDTKKVK